MTVFRSNFQPGQRAPASGEGSRRRETSASLADDIIAAYKKASGDDPDDPDKQDKDDRPEERGPDQTPMVATAEGILAALAKAEGRR